MAFWAAAIPALASIAGGLLGQDAAHDTMKSNEAMFGANQDMQREFAQSGIQWRVEDAKKAGIHPLAALGAQTHSFSPISMAQTPDNSLGQGIAQAGQDLSRAYFATRSPQARTAEIANALQLENMQLNNELLRSQVNKMNSAQVGPGIPGVEVVPNKITASRGGAPSQEAGQVTDLGFARSKSGLVPVPSKDVKERIEDNIIQEFMWALRNNIMPNLGRGDSPGDDYGWNPAQQEWQKGYRFSDSARKFWKENVRGKGFLP